MIVGAGPAGCTAALYCARAGLRTLVLSPTEFGGTMASAAVVANWPGQAEAKPGREVLAAIRAHALSAGAEHRLEAVIGVQPCEDGIITVYTSADAHCVGAVIVATGAAAAAKAPGEAEYQGRGVCYCAACDGPLYRGEKVLVVGQDSQVVEEALTLAGLAEEVQLVCPTPKLHADEELLAALAARRNVQLEVGLALDEITGGECLEGARFRDRQGATREFAATGLFLYLRGSKPATEFLMGCVATDEEGYITTDEMCQTSVPGIFAAGDVRAKHVKQNVVAAAEGCIAALAAERYLRRREGVRLDRGKG